MNLRDDRVLGLDIGGTLIKAGRVDLQGRLSDAWEIPTPLDRPPAEAIALLARAIRTQAGPVRLPAVGVGCAGLVGSDSGVVHLSPNLPTWKEVSLGPLLSQELAAPVFVLNDANAFALAEARAGAGVGLSPVVALTLGTGVGGAVVVDGRLAGGLHGFGGEIGHMSIDWDGPPCPCGNRGCLELFVGRRGLVAAYLQQAAWAPGAVAHDLAGGIRDALDPRLLAEAARGGDPAARQAFARAGEMLGTALANVSNLVDPAVFVIGGGVAQAGDLLLEPARRTLAARAMIGAAGVAPVLEAALGVRAGAIGAGLHAHDRIAGALSAGPRAAAGGQA